MQYIRLPLKGSYNTRDLGGYPTYDGNVTQFNQFLRSDEVGYLELHIVKNHTVIS